jgi:hypothetical protein
MKKLINYLLGDVKEFECGYKGSNESNSSIFITIMLFIILMLGILTKGFSNDTIKKPNSIITIDSNFKELPKEFPTDKIYTSIDGSKYPVYKATNGKYFIKKVSPKTNKEYRYYLIF